MGENAIPVAATQAQRHALGGDVEPVTVVGPLALAGWEGGSVPTLIQCADCAAVIVNDGVALRTHADWHDRVDARRKA